MSSPINTLCPHCQCTTTPDHVLGCAQRDNNTAEHPTTPPPATPTVPGSLWVWQRNDGRPSSWVLWGRVDRAAQIAANRAECADRAMLLSNPINRA